MKYLILVIAISGVVSSTMLIQPKPYKEEDKLQLELAKQLGNHYGPIFERNAKKVAFQSELNCMADNVYYEAASESEEGQMAVATVVENRVHRSGYPKTICGVVYERSLDPQNHKMICQFSWTCKPKIRKAPRLYKQAREIAAKVVMKHQRLAEVNDATLFHGDYVHPDWSDKAEFVSQIGSHRFYRE